MSEVATSSYRYATYHSEEAGKKLRRLIWNVFWILSVVTCTELMFGAYWREWNLNWHFVKSTFITLTIVKSYFIVAYYMHFKDERKVFKYTVMIPYCTLALYLIILCINEGVAVFGTDFLMRW